MPIGQPDIVIAGAGNPWRGDDAAGSLLARSLAEAGVAAQVIDCEEVPENYLDRLAEGPPRIVIFCDAVDFGGYAGQARWFAPEDLVDTSISTHRVSLALLASCLGQAGVASIWVLGIQPAQTEWGTQLSPPVRQTVRRLQAWLEEALRDGPVSLERLIAEEAIDGCCATG